MKNVNNFGMFLRLIKLIILKLMKMNKMLLLVLCLSFYSCLAFTQNSEQIKDKYLIVLDIQQYFTENVIQDNEAEQLIKTINSVIDVANPEKVIYVKSIFNNLKYFIKRF